MKNIIVIICRTPLTVNFVVVTTIKHGHSSVANINAQTKKKVINLIFSVILFGAIRSDLHHSFSFASQTDRAQRQLGPIILCPNRIMNNEGS